MPDQLIFGNILKLQAQLYCRKNAVRKTLHDKN
jgi:hypothetical protein